MRILIVDDEPIARQVLLELVEELPGHVVAGEAATGVAAVEQIARLEPDVVLLDLQMPGLDGFGVARGLKEGAPPVVVFVTAFESHALAAFEAGAVDYLLKPVRRERLAGALEKAQARLTGLRPAAKTDGAGRQRIVGRLGSALHLLAVEDVVAFQAEGDVVRIHCVQGRYYADHSLRALEQKLGPRFKRIHRSTIVNTDHIRTITPLTSKRWLVKLSNGLEAIVSKRMAGTIKETTAW